MLKQITFAPKSHQLTNAQIWSADSTWLVYDCRNQQSQFDNQIIERVNHLSLEVELIYQASQGACVGVATANPRYVNQYIFIHGPQNPAPPWQYNFHYRRGVIATKVQAAQWQFSNFDGFYETDRSLPGVLSGGSHVHMFSPDGSMVSFTYDDYPLAVSNSSLAKRNVAVGFQSPSASFSPVHARQYVGQYYCFLVTQTKAQATFGSDEYERAYEECWIGDSGYISQAGEHQRWAIAFMGDVRSHEGKLYTEIFVADLPATEEGWHTPDLPGAICNQSLLVLPASPADIQIRRLTFTQERAYPGLCHQTRHWLRSSPCGQYIAFLMKDGTGVTQLWYVETANGLVHQLTFSPTDMHSAFTWHPSGMCIAIACNNAIHLAFIHNQAFIPITDSLNPPINPEAVVCSPDGLYVAFTRDIPSGNTRYRQIFTQSIPTHLID